MPKFVIERQYLVPMYQHIVVEADTLEAACDMAVTDDIAWDTQEMDCDNARATTITAAKAIPAGYDVDAIAARADWRRRSDGDQLCLAPLR
jgi:IS5 family transposase